jgi:spore coat protein H
MQTIAIQNIHENIEKMSKILEYVAVILSVLTVCLGCISVVTADSSQDIVQIAGSNMSDPSHSNKADPDYSVLFPDTRVNTMTITISPGNWEKMLDNMTELYGEFGGSSTGDFSAPGGGEQDRDQGMMSMSSSIDPIYVPADISFNGEEWENVGIRFKGFNSLQGSWKEGSYKISFKLNFDKFEDEYPEIKNQRFYGFDELNLQNNYNDDSLLRDKVVPSIFRESGVCAPYTAFYSIYVDYGEGPVYFGLYTMVEAVEDTVIETQFEDDSGNVYKPEGDGATFAEGTFDIDCFYKKTNEDDADWSDVQELYTILNSETRLTNPEQWRAELEAVFDVDEFLRWLATNTVIQNWDTYGVNCRNFYLYTDPTDGRITWIPWDNNYALSSGMNAGNQNPANIPENESGSWNGQPDLPGLRLSVTSISDTKNSLAETTFQSDSKGSAVQSFLENSGKSVAMNSLVGNITGLSLKASPANGEIPENMPDWNPADAGNMNQGGGMGNPISLSLDEVSDSWPLIRYLADDPVYYAKYQNYIEMVVETSFDPSKMEETYRYYHSLIEPYVTGSNGEIAGYTHLDDPENFDTALDELIEHVYARKEAVMEFLSETPINPTPIPTTTPTSAIMSRLGANSMKVTITSPASSVSVTPGQDLDIAWSANGAEDIAYVTFEYSVDGLTWITVADSLPGAGTYAWIVPEVDCSLLTIKITATDESGNTGSANRICLVSANGSRTAALSSKLSGESGSSSELIEEVLEKHGVTQSITNIQSASSTSSKADIIDNVGIPQQVSKTTIVLSASRGGGSTR